MSNYTVTFDKTVPNHPWNKAMKLVREGAEILDVGCSNGNFGAALAQHMRCSVDGIEPDAGDAAKAKKVLHEVFQGTVEEASEKWLSGRKYDHIMFIDVIEHLYQPSETLGLLKKHLKPGGSIIFSIPNMVHISVRLMLMNGKFERGKTGLLDETHLYLYTKDQIERVFNAAGFEVSVWDFTEATYPEHLIKEKLAELGLTSSPEALEKLQEESAQVFQYVGSAVPKENVKRKPVVSYSPDPQGEISRTYEKRVARLEATLRSAEEKAEELERKLSDEKYLAERIRLSHYLQHYTKGKISRVKRRPKS